MGQRISSRVVSALDRGLERAKQQMEDDMKRSIKKNKYGFSDPNAAIGFTRGMDQVDPRQENLTSKDLELNEDLVKFLQDMGPLQKEVNREFTSARLLKQAELDLQASKEASSSLDSELKVHPEESAFSVQDTRSIRSMPLFGDEMAFVTKRTTNFSTNNKSPEDGKLRITPSELYMYKRTGENIVVPQNPSDTLLEQEEQQQQQQLLERALQYIEVPFILKDKDDDLLGVFPNVSDDPLLKGVFRPASSVVFLMENNLDASWKGMSSSSLPSETAEVDVAKSTA